jgi:hypothetical protein
VEGNVIEAGALVVQYAADSVGQFFKHEDSFDFSRGNGCHGDSFSASMSSIRMSGI